MIIIIILSLLFDNLIKNLNLVVDVYHNSQKDCFSVRYLGIVIWHAKSVTLRDVKLIVSEAGRNYSLYIFKRKTVHAYARGVLVAVNDDFFELWLADLCCATYNRFKVDSFVINMGTSEQTPVYEVDWCILANKGVWFKPQPSLESSTMDDRLDSEDADIGDKSSDIGDRSLSAILLNDLITMPDRHEVDRSLSAILLNDLITMPDRHEVDWSSVIDDWQVPNTCYACFPPGLAIEFLSQTKDPSPMTYIDFFWSGATCITNLRLETMALMRHAPLSKLSSLSTNDNRLLAYSCGVYGRAGYDLAIDYNPQPVPPLSETDTT